MISHLSSSNCCSTYAHQLMSFLTDRQGFSRFYVLLTLALLDFLPKEKSFRFRFLLSSSKDDESVETLSSHCLYCCWSVGGDLALVNLSTKGAAVGKGVIDPKDSKNPPAD